jgi:hypothetical protein
LHGEQLLLHLTDPAIEQADLSVQLTGILLESCSYRSGDIGCDFRVELLHHCGSNDLEVGTDGSMFGVEWWWHEVVVRFEVVILITNRLGGSDILSGLEVHRVHICFVVIFGLTVRFRVAVLTGALGRRVCVAAQSFNRRRNQRDSLRFLVVARSGHEVRVRNCGGRIRNVRVSHGGVESGRGVETGTREIWLLS